MSQLSAIDIKIEDVKLWKAETQNTNEKISVPKNSSSFPFGEKNLCNSRVEIICGSSTNVVSG